MIRAARLRDVRGAAEARLGHRPVQARYSANYLRQRNYVDAQTGAVTVPVFGLYCQYDNTVTIKSVLLSGSSETQTTTVTTPNYTGDLHKHPQVVQARTADTSLSYDFILLKNFESANDPLIIDTDGEIRWHGNVGLLNASCILYNNSVYAPYGTSIIREDFRRHHDGHRRLRRSGSGRVEPQLRRRAGRHHRGSGHDSFP